MYDTAAVRLPVGREVVELAAWRQARERVLIDHAKGREHRYLMLNEPGGVQLTLMDRAMLKVERSLPKALHQSNVTEFRQEDVAPALARVDHEVAQLLDYRALPSIGAGDPCRVDYSDNRPLGDEGLVLPLFNRLRPLELPRRGRGVSGDGSVSLSWPRGSFPLKIYGKYEESHEEAARGVVRLEQGVRERRTFLQLLGRCNDETVCLREVLVPEIRERVLSGAVALLTRVAMSPEEMSDWQFVQTLIQKCGVAAASRLTGFCVLYGLAGSPTMKQVAEGRTVYPFKRASVYRQLAELREFRQWFIDQGYYRREVNEPQPWDDAPEMASTGADGKRAMGRPLVVGEVTSQDRALMEYVASLKGERSAA